MENTTWKATYSHYYDLPVSGRRVEVYKIEVSKEGVIIAMFYMSESFNPEVSVPQIDGDERLRIELEVKKRFTYRSSAPW